jgi:hypothetical protein
MRCRWNRKEAKGALLPVRGRREFSAGNVRKCHIRHPAERLPSGGRGVEAWKAHGLLRPGAKRQILWGPATANHGRARSQEGQVQQWGLSAICGSAKSARARQGSQATNQGRATKGMTGGPRPDSRCLPAKSQEIAFLLLCACCI